MVKSVTFKIDFVRFSKKNLRHKTITLGVGIKMSWVAKNRKINNREGATIIRDLRVSYFLTYSIVSVCL